MKAIFDRVPTSKKFPLIELLAAVRATFHYPVTQPVWIRRLGGVGKGTWTYESELDEGNDVVVTFSDLQQLARSDEDCVDELLASIGSIHFGISDSSFMFVQCEDKEVELKIALNFESFRDVPDISLPAPPYPPS